MLLLVLPMQVAIWIFIFTVCATTAKGMEYKVAYIGTVHPFVSSFEASITAARIAAKGINEQKYSDIHLNTTLAVDVRTTNGLNAEAVLATLQAIEDGRDMIMGYSSSSLAYSSGYLGKVYNVAQFTDSASTGLISDSLTYPFFTKANINSIAGAKAFKNTILHYSEVQKGWEKVSIIAKSDAFSVDAATQFINIAGEELSVMTFQQILDGATDFDFELQQIKQASARVILAFVSFEWQNLITAADNFDLVGEDFVWFVPSLVVALPLVNDTLSQGTIGIDIFIPHDTPELEQFVELWNSAADDEEFPFAGNSFNSFQLLSYDTMLAVGHAMVHLENQGLIGDKIDAQTWFNALQRVNFVGTTGRVSFNDIGDRNADVEVLYYSAEDGWVRCAQYSETDNSYKEIEEVVWFSKTTVIPDLDIRDPFNYWSCHKKVERTDDTGKTIKLHTPDGSNIDDIDIDYRCDSFIDCKNLSDEHGCSTDYLITFIVYGIITGFLILICVLMIISVILFGYIFKFRRMRRSSPLFLMVILLSIMCGFISTFAWYGKPHPVACGFQPWLLGLSALSMIISVSVKIFRIWRLFKFGMQKIIISNSELMIYWFVLMAPAVLLMILWTTISTPTAKIENLDGDDHYVCATGGFTGAPGGIIFFSIFVVYAALILLFGAFISFVARNVPSEFNESTLLTISIYNLGFLSAVIIPVFLVVNPINPFIAWILRTTAILYGFSATMILQFVPILWGIIVTDKCRNVRVFKSSILSKEVS